MSWYLNRNGETRGPFDDEAFRAEALAGGILDDDMIWRPGWPTWRKALTVEGVLAPPPLEHNLRAPEAVRSQDTSAVETPALMTVPRSTTPPNDSPLESESNQTIQTSSAPPTPAVQPTRWLSFYTYFRLPVGALAVIGNSLGATTAAPTAEGATLVLWINLARAGLAIAVAVGLASRRRWGWRLNWFQLGSETLIFPLFETSKFASAEDAPGYFLLFLLLMSVIWLVPNGIYFWKRRRLFA